MDIIDEIIASARRIDWAISLLAAIPLSILANLLTPAVGNWWARRSTSKIAHRKDTLQLELTIIEGLQSSPAALAAEGQTALFTTLMWLGLGLAVSGAFSILDFVAGPIASYFFLSAYLRASRHLRLLERCKNFDEYKSQITTQIQALST